MIVIIGGGPAGFFAAIEARRIQADLDVTLLEKGPRVLRKVLVSGGGRCNVTHDCADPRELVTSYPRGSRELRGPFHTFGVPETVDWFARKGVKLKTEADGRMFPVSDSSATITACLESAAREAGVAVRTRCGVTEVSPIDDGFRLDLTDGSTLTATRILLATGGQSVGGRPGTDGSGPGNGLDLARSLGHRIIDPVPSLFTLDIRVPELTALAGVSVPRAIVRCLPPVRSGKDLVQSGPVLITHRGLSGPAVLKLSAWGARDLQQVGYRFDLAVDWTGGDVADGLDARLKAWAHDHGGKTVPNRCPVEIPRRLWTFLVDRAGIGADRRWGDLDRRGRQGLVRELTACVLPVSGKATFKEEFVTCGGVDLKEVDFRTMESRVRPGLFLAGEVLDIDGVTGGFNFQGCWTTGWIAGRGLAGKTGANS